ncbi:leukocyte-associated immunoglobulin-like receptor 1 isoform 2-T2 [Molossus nigricans]
MRSSCQVSSRPKGSGCKWMVQAAGLAVCPRTTTLLALVLCLCQTIYMQEGVLPKPSIWAEPGPVIPRGQPVTIVCWSPAGADVFRLEKKDGSLPYEDQRVSQETQARFHIPAVSDPTAGSYFCHYHKNSLWSKRSEPLELQVTDEDVSTRPSGATEPRPQDSGHLTEYVYILVGISVAFALGLLLLVLVLVHRRRQKQHGSSHSKNKEQRPPERLSPAADITESTPDVATVCTLAEKKREAPSPSPAAEENQEVTYAQLNHRTLTQRAAQAASPQSTEPTADSNTYAALAIR